MKNAIPITPREVAEAVTSDILHSILDEYSFSTNAQEISYHRLYGGIRNAVFLVKTPEEKYVLTIYKPSPTAQGRVERNLKIYSYLRPRGFPVPEVVVAKDGSLYLRRDVLGAERFISCHRYIGGRKIFPYGEKELSSVASMHARLHKELRDFPHKNILLDTGLEVNINTEPTVLHMDFARGNILFTEESKISAVLDFEGAAWGPPIVDIAKALAIITKDNETLPAEIIKNMYLKSYRSVTKNIVGIDLLDNLISNFATEII